ncbi:hypothetical protein FisN_6Lh175 [Fistulifera solaris]|uniref:Phosphatidylinositol glycan, class T n=1 Tax=Fistulifera solaris TaxID=1519565 RepID=A0A1Z5J6K7_FISSO|nr:hypothetical protein FisN_6Lh175 [Fistulifera solaris]|eukprot:GAX09448.1 hypothetical protein FisN_6Lh175 [Fistulifera solaris]
MFQTKEHRIWLAPVAVDDGSVDWHVRIVTRERLPHDLRRLLQQQSADRVFMQASSEAQTYFPFDPFHSLSPSDWAVRSHPGVTVTIANSTTPEHLFQQLVLQHRLLLTSTNTRTKRLHRYAHEKDGDWSIVLPTEGSAAVSVEALRDDWMTDSNWLLETTSRHRLWIEIEGDYIERGLQYIVQSSRLPTFKDLIPVPVNRPVLADPIQMELVSASDPNIEWNSDLCEAKHETTCLLRSSISIEYSLFRKAVSPTPHDDDETSVLVDYHLYTAMAHTGTLLTRIDTSTPTVVHQHLPPVLKPRWASLKVQTESGRMLRWDELLTHDIVFAEDGVHLTYGWNESFSVSLQFDPRFWSLDSIPGDPNRGIELPPVWVDFSEGTVSSNTVLLLPPLPDLSMPFNVLSLTCTLYAFVIGSTMSLLIRKASQSVQEELDPSKKTPSKMSVIKKKLKAFRNKLLRRSEPSMVFTKEGSLSSDKNSGQEEK